MKKFLIKSSIAGLSVLAFSTAQAQSSPTAAVVKFTGSITNTTCVVNSNDRNKSVVFGAVPSNASGFTNGGVNAGDTAVQAYERPLEITLDNCSAAGQNQQPSNVQVRVTGQDVLTSVGRLRTTNGSVHIQLLELDRPTNTDVPWNIANTSQLIPLVAGTNVLKFKARYYVHAANSLVPGPANAEATFNMEYQ